MRILHYSNDQNVLLMLFSSATWNFGSNLRSLNSCNDINRSTVPTKCKHNLNAIFIFCYMVLSRNNLKIIYQNYVNILSVHITSFSTESMLWLFPFSVITYVHTKIQINKIHFGTISECNAKVLPCTKNITYYSNLCNRYTVGNYIIGILSGRWNSCI